MFLAIEHIHNSRDVAGWQLMAAMLLVIMLLLYIGAANVSSTYKHLRKWPLYRILYCSLSVFCAAITMIGPLAELAHKSFTAHMVSHLLLGMLSPLLLALATPLTLFLRTMPTTKARQVASLLKSLPAQLLSHPIIAALLNIGGLWLLYTTKLYTMMQESMLLHLLIHTHVFLAGYLFTISILQIESTSHRYSFHYRAVILVLALAAHGILAKYIYAFPLPGVSEEQAQLGGMIMYYGGDVIDILLILLFCLQWYRATRPRSSSAAKNQPSSAIG